MAGHNNSSTSKLSAGGSSSATKRTRLLMLVVALVGIITLLLALDGLHFHSDAGNTSGSSSNKGGRLADQLHSLRERFLDHEDGGNGEEQQQQHTTAADPADDAGLPNSKNNNKGAVGGDDNNDDQLTTTSPASFKELQWEDEADHYGPVPIRGSGTYHNPYPHYNRSAKRPCTGLSYTQGKWVKREGMKARYDAYGEILGCCQRGYEAEHGKGAQRPETQYVWESDECDLHEWNEELFCKALRGRNLMIAGDSLNDHWHASLFYLLGGKKDIYRKEGTTRGKRACATHPICGKYYPQPLKLYFLTNQLLEEERRLNRNYKWWKHIHQYPILVLNAGSWMRDPADETREVSDDEYFRHMEKALRIVKRQNFTGTLIWRTTYQGHPYCWNYDKPLTEELKGEDFPRVAPYLRYRWWAIPHRNNYTVNMWRKAGAHIMDVRRITNLMPLGHLGKYHPKFKERNVTDCLHYCAPSPVYDTWSTLLMNLLAGNIDGV